MWAYWQAIKPRHKIFRRPYPGRSRFATATGTIITPDSPLKPFRDGYGNYHTTKSVANIEGLGYSYYGLEYWIKAEKQMSREAKRLINRLYGDDSSAAGRVMSQTNGGKRFLVRIKLDVAQIERPVSVSVRISDKKAGSMVIMAEPRQGIVHGAFPVDDALDAAGIGLMDVNDTIEAIQASISVTLTKVGDSFQSSRWSLLTEAFQLDGQSIPLSRKSGLEVDIEDVDIIAGRSEDELPAVGMARSRPATFSKGSFALGS